MIAVFSQGLVECVGWTLVHFLWQGAAVAAVLAVALRLLRNGAANHRYLAGCAALLLLAVAPVMTFQRVANEYRLSPIPADESINAPTAANGTLALLGTNSKPALVVVARPEPGRLGILQRLEGFLPWVVVGWGMGVSLLSLRLVAGWLQIKRLERRAISAVDALWHAKLAELGRRLGMARPVRLLQSALVEVPTVIGWLRPMILLPTGCLVGLAPAQLEAILAHELAHIRRHDYLVNLLQNVVETLLFYHPAVWWVSLRVREERENCCDDLAVEVCGDRMIYARALTTLEELRYGPPSQLGLAASGAPLLQRVRRLMGQSSKGASRSAWPVAGIITLLVVAMVAGGLRGNRAVAQDNATSGSVTSSNQVQANVTNDIKITNAVAVTNQTTFTVAAEGTPPLYYQWKLNGTNIAGATSNVSGSSNLSSEMKSSRPARRAYGRREIVSKLNDIVIDSAKYDHLPLEELAKDLATVSESRDSDHKGINFYVDPRLPVTTTASMDVNMIGVTVPELRHLRLADLLDAIVRGADVPIKYSILDYAVVFSLAEPNGPMAMRVFKIDPNTFKQGLEGVQGIPFGNNLGGGVGGTGGGSGGSSSGGGQSSGVVMPHVNVSSGISGVTSGSARAASGGGSFGSSTGASDGGNLNSGMVRQFISSLGVDLDTSNPANAGKEVDYDERTSSIVVRAPEKDMEKVAVGIDKANRAPKEVNIKVKLVEIDDDKNSKATIDAVLGGMKDAVTTAFPGMQPMNPPIAGISKALPGMTNAILLQVSGTLTREDFKKALEKLEQCNGVDELTAPEVTTGNDRRAQIQMVDITNVVTGREPGFDSNGKPMNVYKTAEVPLGPVIDLVPKISDDGLRIQMKVTPTITEFVGYDYGAPSPPSDNPKPMQQMPLPHFRLREMTTDLEVGDGDTIVVSGIDWEVTTVKDKVPVLGDTPLLGRLFRSTKTTNTKRRLIVFVTPTIINPDGSRAHAEAEKPTTEGKNN